MVNILLDLFKYVKLYLKQDSSQMLIKQMCKVYQHQLANKRIL